MYAVQDGLGTMNSKLTSLSVDQQYKKWDETLDWLAPCSYKSQQADLLQKQEKDTGKWFLEHQTFRTWLDRQRSIQTLFCHGLPGAGKTIIASIVIDCLWNSRQEKNSIVAFLHCNYNMQSQQTTEKMLRTILRQFAEQVPSILDNVAELHESSKEQQRHPSLKDISEAVYSVAKSFKSVFLVIDALDECPTENLMPLLDVIWNLQKSGTSFMATSRPLSVEQAFKQHAVGLSRLEIRADYLDVETYIDRNFDSSKYYADMSDVVKFKETIAEAADGM